MVGPGPARGPGLMSVLRAGLGHTFCGPGPGLMIQFAGRVCTTAAGPGLGLKSYLRAGPGPQFHIFRPMQGPSAWCSQSLLYVIS